MLVTDTHCSLPLHEPLTFVHSEFQAVAEAKLPAQSFLLITPPLGYREELGCLWLLRAVPGIGKSFQRACSTLGLTYD